MSDVANTTSSFSDPHALTPRQQFLHSHGFQRDPFRFHVTEQAWGLQRSFRGEDDSIRTWLTEWRDHFQHPTVEYDPPETQFPRSEEIPILLLTGLSGSGKTALLYHQMEQAYREHSETLVIFYDFTELLQQPTPIPVEEYQLRAIVVAVVLHLLRDFTDYRREDVQQWLSWLVVIGGEVVQWWMQGLSQRDDARRTTWQFVRHPLLYPLEITPARRILLEGACNTTFPSETSTTADSKLFQEKITPILEALNIRQCQLYIDNLTQEGMAQAQIREHVHSIITKDYLYDKKIQRIITVPSDLVGYYRYWLEGSKGYVNITTITILWNTNELQSLLGKRCCSREGQVELFENTTKSKLSNLETHLLQQAAQSPRRLLMMVSALLDAHAVCTPSAEELTETLWEYVRSHWEFEGNPPEALPTPA